MRSSGSGGDRVEDRLFGIFGAGRSGTTWLGSILNTHPDVAYRFEPFHRLRSDARLKQLRARIESLDFGPQDLEPLYRFFLQADPMVDRPPFFQKRGARSLGRSWVWPPARRFRFAAPLYRLLFTPSGTPPVVFKEVTLERLMRRFLERTAMRVVYLVRHPCGVTSSVRRGQESGLMTSRQQLLPRILLDHDASLAERLGPGVENLDPLEKEALLWRIDVERGVRAAEGREQALLVIYEELCDRPEETTERVFAHLGLEVPDETRAGLREMTEGSARRSRSERWSNAYFSVFRDPRSASRKWRRELSADDQSRVLSLVADSPAFQACSKRGFWDV